MLLQIDTLNMARDHQWCDSLQKQKRGLQMTTSMNGDRRYVEHYIVSTLILLLCTSTKLGWVPVLSVPFKP